MPTPCTVVIGWYCITMLTSERALFTRWGNPNILDSKLHFIIKMSRFQVFQPVRSFTTSITTLLPDIVCLEQLQLCKSLHLFSTFIHFIKMSSLFMTLFLFSCAWKPTGLSSSSIAPLFGAISVAPRRKKKTNKAFFFLSAPFLSPLIDLNCNSATTYFPFPTETHPSSFNHREAGQNWNSLEFNAPWTLSFIAWLEVLSSSASNVLFLKARALGKNSLQMRWWW